MQQVAIIKIDKRYILAYLIIMNDNDMVAVDQIAVRLLRSALRVVRRAGALRGGVETLRPSKLTALDSIARNEGLTVDELARREGVREPTISTHLDELRQARMVEEFADLADRRVTKLRATPKGTERLKHDGIFYASVIRRVKRRDLPALAAAVEVLEQAFEAELEERRRRQQRDREQRTPPRPRRSRTSTKE